MHSFSLLQSENKSKIVQLLVSQEDARRRILATQIDQIAKSVEPEYLKYYEKEYGDKSAAPLARAASVLEAIIAVIRMEDIKLSKRWFVEDLEEILKIWKIRYLPKSPRRLHEKLVEFLESGQRIIEAVQPYYVGNTNAVKTDAEITGWL